MPIPQRSGPPAGEGPDRPAQPPAARAPEAGTQPAGALNPNMFGDFFGGAGSTRLLFAPTPGAFQATGDLFFTPTRLAGGGTTGAPFTAIFSPGAPGSSVTVSVDGFGRRTFSQFPLLTGDIRQQLISPQPPSTFLVNRQTTNIFSVLIDPINNTAAGRMAMAGVLNSVKGSNGPVLTSIDSLSLASTGTFSSIEYGYTVTASALGTVPFELGIPLNNPAAGGVVGRTKISEDNSPIPRDRVFFNYDYYGDALLTRNGFDVHRMSAGFESTFAGGQGSVEVRVPFASTLDSTFTVGGLSARNTELGNVAVALKWLLNPGAEVQFAAGLAAALPTGNDSVVTRRRDRTGPRAERDGPAHGLPGRPVDSSDRMFAQAWGR